MRKACCLVLLPALLALADGGKCDTCHGDKQVKCFALAGHPTVEAECPMCQGAGGFACAVCGAKGKLDCPACRGTGKVNTIACHFCSGAGKIACKLCKGGQVPCALCNGKKVVAQPCLVCSGRGKLPCPDCAKPDGPCPVCEGKKTEKCPACAGTGEMPQLCPQCRGLRFGPCQACNSIGYIPCVACEGLGAYLQQDKAGAWRLGKPCQTCKGSGGKNCDACKGAGGSPCKACNGKGSVGGKCWLCDGTKTIPCRRCVQGVHWGGEEKDSAAFVSVYPCDGVEPQVEKGVKFLAPATNLAAYLVVVDMRNAKKPITLGLADWSIAMTTDAGDAMLVDPTPLTEDARKALEKRLPSWGMPADACHGAAFAPGTVGVHLALVDRETAKRVKGFRLKSMKEATQVVELKIGTLDVCEWQRDCAAAIAKPAK